MEHHREMARKPLPRSEEGTHPQGSVQLQNLTDLPLLSTSCSTSLYSL